MTSPTSAATPAVDSTAIDQVISFARAQIGKPYVFGATGPDSYDCSGLVQAAYASAGIHISRTTFTQIMDGIAEVSQATLAIGDLVFPDAGHVQIYSGNGNVIEAPHEGANVREVAMWGFWRARRIVNGGQMATQAGLFGIPGVPDPLSTAKSIFDLLAWPEKLASHLTNGDFIRRIGKGVLGLGLVIVGLVLVLKGSGYLAEKTKEVKSVAEIAGAFA